MQWSKGLSIGLAMLVIEETSAYFYTESVFEYANSSIPQREMSGWHKDNINDTGMHLAFHGAPHNQGSPCWAKPNGSVVISEEPPGSLLLTQGLYRPRYFSPGCQEDGVQGSSYAGFNGEQTALFVQTGPLAEGVPPFWGPERNTVPQNTGHSATSLTFRFNPQRANWPNDALRAFDVASDNAKLVVSAQARVASLRVPLRDQSVSFYSRVLLINRACWLHRENKQPLDFGLPKNTAPPLCQVILQFKWMQRHPGGSYENTDAYAYPDCAQGCIPVIYGYVGALGQTTRMVASEVHRTRGAGNGTLVVWRSAGGPSVSHTTEKIKHFQAEVLWEQGDYERIVDIATRKITHRDRKDTRWMQYFFGGALVCRADWQDKTQWYVLDTAAAIENYNPFWAGAVWQTDQVAGGVVIKNLRIEAK